MYAGCSENTKGSLNLFINTLLEIRATMLDFRTVAAGHANPTWQTGREKVSQDPQVKLLANALV